MTIHEDDKTATTAAELKQKVSDDLDSISDLAKSGVSTASEKAKEAATDQKNVLARKLGSVAEALGKVSSELDRGENRDIGGLTRNLGTNLRNASESIQDRSLGEIASMAEDFGRKQPLAFLSIAAIAGLAASRFLVSSAPSSTALRTPTSRTDDSQSSSTGLTSPAPMSVATTEGRLHD